MQLFKKEKLNRLFAKKSLLDALVVSSLTVAAMLVEGYHPAVEDDAVYLAAVKHRLDPSLFPHDSAFFTLQLQASVFDKFMAGLVHLSRLSLPWAEFLCQILAVAGVLWGCLRLARLCFPSSRRAQFAAVSTIAVLLPLGVAGTALMLVDQHLHPRTVATALILLALAEIPGKSTPRRWMQVGVLLAVATLFHPIMGLFGASLAAMMVCAFHHPGFARTLSPGRALTATVSPALAAASGRYALLLFSPVDVIRSFSWVMDPPSPAWRIATGSHRYLYLWRWHWYELLGLAAPPLILMGLRKLAQRQGRTEMAHLLRALQWFFAVQFCVAIVFYFPGMERLLPLQPMRFLHLIYLCMFLLAGGLLGEFLLRRKTWIWPAMIVLLAGVMYQTQAAQFPKDAHLELPGHASQNPWVQAFSWVRLNTPKGAYFALPPAYMDLPGEGEHGFRSVAERSILADTVKDAAVAMQVPRLAGTWQQQVNVAAQWDEFTAADFQRLGEKTGVDWLLVRSQHTAGLVCPYNNSVVAACRMP